MKHNPWKTMSLDEARAYDERKETGPLRHQIAVKRELLWRTIKAYLPEDRRLPVLDLGGGTGVWAVRLASEGYQVILTDISPGFLARAWEKVNALHVAEKVAIEEADITDLGRFPEDHFPLVLALGDPLSYCGDPEGALREMLRVTKPGGVLVADVECKYGGIDTRRAQTLDDIRMILHEGVAHWPGSDQTACIRLFAPSEIRALAESTGWEVLSMYPSDLLISLVEKDLMDKLLLSSGEQMIKEWVSLEEQIRGDQHLLGCGPDVQFVLGKPVRERV